MMMMEVKIITKHTLQDLGEYSFSCPELQMHCLDGELTHCCMCQD